MPKFEKTSHRPRGQDKRERAFQALANPKAGLKDKAPNLPDAKQAKAKRAGDLKLRSEFPAEVSDIMKGSIAAGKEPPANASAETFSSPAPEKNTTREVITTSDLMNEAGRKALLRSAGILYREVYEMRDAQGHDADKRGRWTTAVKGNFPFRGMYRQFMKALHHLSTDAKKGVATERDAEAVLEKYQRLQKLHALVESGAVSNGVVIEGVADYALDKIEGDSADPALNEKDTTGAEAGKRSQYSPTGNETRRQEALSETVGLSEEVLDQDGDKDSREYANADYNGAMIEKSPRTSGYEAVWHPTRINGEEVKSPDGLDFDAYEAAAKKTAEPESAEITPAGRNADGLERRMEAAAKSSRSLEKAVSAIEKRTFDNFVDTLAEYHDLKEQLAEVRELLNSPHRDESTLERIQEKLNDAKDALRAIRKELLDAQLLHTNSSAEEFPGQREMENELGKSALEGLQAEKMTVENPEFESSLLKELGENPPEQIPEDPAIDSVVGTYKKLRAYLESVDSSKPYADEAKEILRLGDELISLRTSSDPDRSFVKRQAFLARKIRNLAAFIRGEQRLEEVASQPKAQSEEVKGREKPILSTAENYKYGAEKFDANKLTIRESIAFYRQRLEKDFKANYRARKAFAKSYQEQIQQKKEEYKNKGFWSPDKWFGIYGQDLNLLAKEEQDAYRESRARYAEVLNKVLVHKLHNSESLDDAEAKLKKLRASLTDRFLIKPTKEKLAMQAEGFPEAERRSLFGKLKEVMGKNKKKMILGGLVIAGTAVLTGGTSIGTILVASATGTVGGKLGAWFGKKGIEKAMAGQSSAFENATLSYNADRLAEEENRLFSFLDEVERAKARRDMYITGGAVSGAIAGGIAGGYIDVNTGLTDSLRNAAENAWESTHGSTADMVNSGAVVSGQTTEMKGVVGPDAPASIAERMNPPVRPGIDLEMVDVTKPEPGSFNTIDDSQIPVPEPRPPYNPDGAIRPDVAPPTPEKPLGIYTAQPGDNFWDIVEGQTEAPQPPTFEYIQQTRTPHEFQVFIDEVRDVLDRSPDVREALGFGDTMDKLQVGSEINMDAMEKLARDIAEHKGWIEPSEMSTPNTLPPGKMKVIDDAVKSYYI